MSKQILSLIVLILHACNAIAAHTVRDSQQLLLILTKDWNAVNGVMQRYQRDSRQSEWVAVGKPKSVVVGKKGLAWGVNTGSHVKESIIKKEGDMRSPAGIFAIQSAFGFAAQKVEPFKIPYLALKSTSVCVDDAQSKYYNKIINTASITNPDWNSGEQMQQVPQYKWGALIEYNTNKPVPHAGSCIFLHIWRSPNAGTAGCVAMSESDLKQVLSWLDSQKQPVIAVLTKHMMNQQGKILGLPLLKQKFKE